MGGRVDRQRISVESDRLAGVSGPSTRCSTGSCGLAEGQAEGRNGCDRIGSLDTEDLGDECI